LRLAPTCFHLSAFYIKYQLLNNTETVWIVRKTLQSVKSQKRTFNKLFLFIFFGSFEEEYPSSMVTVGIPYDFNRNNRIINCMINLNLVSISKAYIKS